MPSDPLSLKTGEIWQATLTVVRPQLWLLVAVAAPFTLLIDMILAVFGPAVPTSPADFTPRVVLLLILLPSLIGGLAQLAVAHLIVRPEQPPRLALAAAFAAFPSYLAAVLLAAVPTGLAFVLLVVPGLYVLARLFLIVPIAAIERRSAIETIRRSWLLTANAGGTLLLFLLLALLFVLGVSVLSQGVGAALGSAITLLGSKAAGGFAAALVASAVGMLISIVSAAASTVIYLKLR